MSRQSKYGVNLTQVAKKLGVSVRTIHLRIERGWNIEDAISVPYIAHKDRIGIGIKKGHKFGVDIKKAAEDLGLSDRTIYSRLRQGWSVKKAISTPHLRRKEARPVDSCDKLKDALSHLYGTIDKILQSKIAMRKLAKLPELAEHFTGLDKADNELIDEAIGGIKVNILNNPKPDKEFIYNVVGTDGQTLQTNDKAKFMAFLAEVA
jgi:IS30 family transposase